MYNNKRIVDGFYCHDSKIVYISGHAFDRYCERQLKKPGYEMTDDELIQVYLDLNPMVVKHDTITNELYMCFDSGMFKGYADEDGNMFFKTFLATSNLYPGQSMTKKELNDIVADTKETDELFKLLSPREKNNAMELRKAISQGVQDGIDDVLGNYTTEIFRHDV